MLVNVFADIGGCFSNPCLTGTCFAQDHGGFSCVCPDGYVGNTCGERIIESNGIKYYILEERLSWPNARSACISRNLILTSVVNRGAHNLLRGYT